MPQVMTVTGPIDSSQLGVVLPHEHVYLNHMAENRSDGLLNNERLMIRELQRLVEAGGRTRCELTTNGIGRQPELLRRAAEATGLNIDLRYFDTHSTDEIAADIVRDIECGVGETGVRAGIIGEIACDKFITPVEERSFRAAARAQRTSGLTITTHAARWPVGLAQLDLLEEEGVDLGWVIVGHSDTVPIPGYQLALARRGAYVQFDTVIGHSDYETQFQIELVLELVTEGYLQRVLLSQDTSARTHLHAMGGNGYTFLLTRFLPDAALCGPGRGANPRTERQQSSTRSNR